jgi:DNA-binding transcriptional LysR family regulator
MTFAQTKSFHLAARQGTFAEAQRMNTTQPAVPARIAALELELGMRLPDLVLLAALWKARIRR